LSDKAFKKDRRRFENQSFNAAHLQKFSTITIDAKQIIVAEFGRISKFKHFNLWDYK